MYDIILIYERATPRVPILRIAQSFGYVTQQDFQHAKYGSMPVSILTLPNGSRVEIEFDSDLRSYYEDHRELQAICSLCVPKFVCLSFSSPDSVAEVIKFIIHESPPSLVDNDCGWIGTPNEFVVFMEHFEKWYVGCENSAHDP